MVKNGKINQHSSQNIRSLTVRQVNKSLKTSGDIQNIMRRSVTIDNQLHDYIVELRGWFGIEKHLDLDYTTILNMLAILGADLFSDTTKLTEKQKEFVLKYVENDPEKKMDAASDEWWNNWLRAKIPEYDPELVEEPQTDGAEGKKEQVSQSQK